MPLQLKAVRLRHMSSLWIGLKVVDAEVNQTEGHKGQVHAQWGRQVMIRAHGI